MNESQKYRFEDLRDRGIKKSEEERRRASKRLGDAGEEIIDGWEV